MAPRTTTASYALLLAAALVLLPAQAQLSPGGAVEDFFNTAQPPLPYYTPNLAAALQAGCANGCVMGVNDLLQYFAPQVAPQAAFAGTCATSAAQFTLSGKPSWLTSSQAVPTNITTPAYNGTVNAAGVTGTSGNSGCIVLPNTGNQTNTGGTASLDISPVIVPTSQSCFNAQGLTLLGNSSYLCNSTASPAYYPRGINPVPPGITITGVVFYTSSKTHTYIMDPFYPFASIWLQSSKSIGVGQGVAVGQLLNITLQTQANIAASGPSFDPGAFNFGVSLVNASAILAYNSTTLAGGPSSISALATNPLNGFVYVPAASSGGTGPGFGGVADQCAYCGAPDNMWILEMNTQNAPGYKSGSLAPGVTIASPAGSWPYDPAGGATYYSAPSNKSSLLISQLATPVVVNTAVAPPPPTLDAPLPPAITLPAGCLTVEQFLCKYTVGNMPNPNTTTQVTIGSTTYAATGADSLCGVFYFGTGTGNGYVQDPFAPFSSIWINDNNWNNFDSFSGLSMKPSTAYDGSSIKQALGYDGGFTAGMYLRYTFKNATVYDTAGNNGFIASTQMNIWSVSLFGLVFNNATCDYSNSSVTTATCPPSNCMLSACNARNIQDDGPFGDFCDGYSGSITVNSTLGCGISLLTPTLWPALNTPYALDNPFTTSGGGQCPDFAKPVGLPPTQVIYFSAQVAINGYTPLTFTFTQAAQFSSAVATVLSTAAQTVTIPTSAVSIQAVYMTPVALMSGSNFLVVSYTVSVQSQYSQSIRVYMSNALSGSNFVHALVAAGLSAVTEADLVSSPKLTSTTVVPLNIFFVEDYLNTAEPTIGSGLWVNDMLKNFAPNVDPALAYPGTCATNVNQYLGGVASKFGGATAVPQNFPAPQTYPPASPTTCIILPNTGNQTNIGRDWVAQPVAIPSSTCFNTAGVPGNCVQTGNTANYTQGINPVPVGTVFQGVVFYASSKHHTYLMDPFYPYASIWVVGQNCFGVNSGLAVGQLVTINITTTANFAASGPTFDPGFFGFDASGGCPAGYCNSTYTAMPQNAGSMPGFGGAADQASYNGVKDNMWVLNLNMYGDNPNRPSTYAKNSPCPGVTITSAAETWPYAVAGGINYYAVPSNKSQLLVPTTQSAGFTAAPPPPPLLDAPLPTPVSFASGCMTVEQFLCQYTVGTAVNPVTVNATSGLTLAGGCVAGVMYFMTTTGNAYIQDPFAPYASIWINDNGWGAGSDQFHGMSITNSVNADGTTDHYYLGLDAGWGVGQYLQYTYTYASLATQPGGDPNGYQASLGVGTGVGIWSVSLFGLKYNNRTCNYAGADTVASCPPTNCQYAQCQGRNIQADFGPDYCTNYSNPTGPTPQNTVGCGIQMLGFGWPIMGQAPPADNPLLSTGVSQCPDNAKPTGLAAMSGVNITTTIALGGYTTASFTSTVSAAFATAMASFINVPAPPTVTVTSVVSTVTNLGSGEVPVDEATYQFVSVTFVTTVQSQYTATARAYLSNSLESAQATLSSTLTALTEIQLITAPVVTGYSPAPPPPPPPPSPPPPSSPPPPPPVSMPPLPPAMAGTVTVAASLTLSGLTVAQFTGAVQTAFVNTLATQLSVAASAITITGVTAASGSGRHLLQTNSINVAFTVTTTSSAVASTVSSQITTISTGSGGTSFAAALVTAGVPTTGVALAVSPVTTAAPAAAPSSAAAGRLAAINTVAVLACALASLLVM